MNGERRLLALIGGYFAIVCMTIVMFGVDVTRHFLIGLVFGTCFASAIIAALWAIFGPGKKRARFPVAAVFLFAVPATLLYLKLHEPAIMLLVCQLAIFSTIVGIGLLLRLTFRAQLSKSNIVQVEAPKTPPTSQYGIRHLMILTTAIAILLTIGRLATPYIAAYSGNDQWIFAFLALGVCVICMPIIFSVLALNRNFFPTVIIFLLSGIATLGEFSLFQSLPMKGPVWIDFVWINAMAFLPVLLASIGLRLCGYRLVRQLSLVPATTSHTLLGAD